MLTRADMYRAFVLGRHSPHKTAGLATLRRRAPFVGGYELASVVDSLEVGDESIRRTSADADAQGYVRRRLRAFTPCLARQRSRR